MQKKIPTGIYGLDKMLNGGLVKGRTYLIKGGPGTGKTILSMQFLINGSLNNEKTLYITLEESIEEVKENMNVFGFDLSNIKLVDASPTGNRSIYGDLFLSFDIDVQGFKTMLENEFEKEKPDRLVIDSITMLRVSTGSETEYRRDLLALIGLLKRYDVTALLTSEISKDCCIEDYLVSGVIELHTMNVKGRMMRGIRILKMRGSDFDDTMRPYRITSRGLEVYSDLSLFE